MKYVMICLAELILILTSCAQAANEAIHTADQNGDQIISLSELLRVIQFFNSDGLHCEMGTEDTFAPGPGDQSCESHDSDYNPQDWHINLSELLRIIQFFNLDGYHALCGTEDNFAPGAGQNDPCTEGEGSVEGEGGGEGEAEGQAEGMTEGSDEGGSEGALEGQPEGIVEGVVEGQVEGEAEGQAEGVSEGSDEGGSEGSSEGQPEGTGEGASEGQVEGDGEGQPEGILEGLVEGQPEGIVEGIIEGQVEGEDEGEGVLEGQFEGMLEGEGFAEGPVEGEEEGIAEGEGSLEGEGTSEGTEEGEGIFEGQAEGQPEGTIEGIEEGQLEGEGMPEGQIEGSFEGEGTAEGEGLLEGEEEGESSTEGEAEGEGQLEGEGEGNAEGVIEGEGSEEGEVEMSEFQRHSGANLPWIHYGWDLGDNPWGGLHEGFSSNTANLNEDFGILAEHGAGLVRVFLFCDLRTGVVFSKDAGLSFDEFVYEDMNALLDAAAANHLMLMPVLFDYLIADGVSQEGGSTVGEHPELLTTEREDLIALISEFLAAYGGHPNIYAWDIINEPEYASAVTQAEMATFVTEVTEAIHTNTNHLATLGSRDRASAYQWQGLGLDLYQFHHYDNMGLDLETEFPPVNGLGLDRPVIVGELQPTFVQEKLLVIERNGFVGALFWSLNADYDFASSADSFAAYFDGASEGEGFTEGEGEIEGLIEGGDEGEGSIEGEGEGDEEGSTEGEGEGQGEIVYFPDAGLDAAVRAAIGKPTGDILSTDLLGLESLDAYWRSIIDLTGIEYCTDLVSLNLNSNHVDNLGPLNGLVDLTQLVLSNNQVVDLSPLNRLTNLTGLVLSNNQVVDLNPLGGLVNLARLLLSNNQVADLSPLSGLTNLTGLMLSNIQVVDLSPLSGLVSLTELDLSNNHVSDLSPLNALNNLTVLYLRGNEVNDLSPLDGLVKLGSLYLSNNEIQDISPLAGLTGLITLELENNHIADISVLSGLSMLRYMYIGGNRIEGIQALASLANLRIVDMDDNLVNDISPLISNAGFGSGDSVYLQDNLLSQTALCEHVPELHERGANVYFDGECLSDLPTGRFAEPQWIGAEKAGCVALALNPYVPLLGLVFVDVNLNKLFYAELHESTWEVYEVDNCSSSTQCSLAFTDSGEPFISYYRSNESGAYSLCCARLVEGAWRIDAITGIGSMSSTVIVDPVLQQPIIFFNSTGDYNIYKAAYVEIGGEWQWQVTLLSYSDACSSSALFSPFDGAMWI